jgi:hypothetical protein
VLARAVSGSCISLHKKVALCYPPLWCYQGSFTALLLALAQENARSLCEEILEPLEKLELYSHHGFELALDIKFQDRPI